MKGIPAYQKDIPWQDLGGGVSRRELSCNEALMSVEVRFEKGGEGAPHTHQHTQCSYVISGVFDYTVDGETVTLRQGDSIVVPGGLLHGTVCLEAGTLLDIFTPARQDFLK